ncbi:MAG: hypothetical protein ACI8QT_001846 [Halioglobus sp.]
MRQVRHTFDLSDQLMLSIFRLGGHEGSKLELATWLAHEGEPEFVVCEDENFARFLNGLIINNRGAKDGDTPEPEPVLSNNMVLQKLKIALNLQADDLLEILKLNEVTLSKHALSALFRRPDHKKYRECPDQLLCNVLDGMEKHYRKNQT